MSIRHVSRSLVLASCLTGAPMLLNACAAATEVPVEDLGSAFFELKLADGVELVTVAYDISGNGYADSGTVDVLKSKTLKFKVAGIPAGTGYLLALTAAGPAGSGIGCTGTATFDVSAGQVTTKKVHLQCKLPKKGSLLVNGEFNVCPTVDGITVLPEETSVGGTIQLLAVASDVDGVPAPLSYQWVVDGGALSSDDTAATSLTCTEAGEVNVTLAAGDSDCEDVVLTTVTCSPEDGSGGGEEAPVVVWNEVESNGGTPGDWAEIYNAGDHAADLSGYTFKDNDDTHAYVLPPGSTLAPGGYLVVEESQMGFGLGGADSVRLFDPEGAEVIAYSWTAHSTLTYGRCPNGSGEWATTTASTKGSTNACAVSITFNEVESSGGTPGDWVELVNPGTSTVDLSGWTFKDSDDTHAYVLPAGTTVAPGAYLVLDEAAFGFGLGGGDSVRLYMPGDILVETYSYLAHATTTYGRCPDTTGAFGVTTGPSKGAVNACPLDPNLPAPWPGSSDVVPVDAANAFPSNLSGLHYQPGTVPVLWAALNSPSKIYRLVQTGSEWAPEAGEWATGKLLQFPGGVGQPDTESVTKAEWNSPGIYVASERNNEASSVSRLSVLRFDETAPGGTLVATDEWTFTAELPVVGSNLGFEAITWIPDSYLVASGLHDQLLGKTYDPSDYPDHGAGLFALGVEGTGLIYILALDHASDDGFIVATLSSGMVGTMALEFDRDNEVLWAGCDDTCGNQVTLLDIDATGAAVVKARFARPTGLPNSNNEGFALVSEAECVGGQKSVFWADDANTASHALRQGSVNCGPLF